MFHSRSGEKIGIFYSSKDDINIPYNLYIAVSYIKQTLTLEFSSKILKEKYPDLISRDTIKECLTNINQLNICDIDVDSILSNGAITSVDVTYDANLILSDNLLDALNSQVNNYRRFKWAHYDKEGIMFTKDVKSKDCTETITLYNKEKEICTIQSFFPELSYLDIEKALKGLKRIDHLLIAPSFLKRGLIYGCFHLTFNFHKLQGLIINYHHNKEMEKYNDILDKIYQQALKESLIYLPLYIQNYKKHAPLPERYYHNYK